MRSDRQHNTLAPIIIAGLFTLASSVHASTPSAASKPQAPVASTRPIANANIAKANADVRSGAFLVVDGHSEDVLLAKQADTAMPIASITKLMTALVVLDAEQPLDEPLQITKDDRDIEIGGRSRLVVGASLSRRDLLHLALMSSENRAANALGRNYPGGLPALLRAMNAKAKALGMTSSRFADATGLSSDNIASPRDLVRLVNAASSNRMIRELSTAAEHTVMISGHPVQYRNTNTLVDKPDWDVVVQKTGFTNAAGQCLVMKAMIQGRPVVMVLMNSFGKYTRVADARRVRKWMEAADHVAYTGTGSQAVRAK